MIEQHDSVGVRCPLDRTAREIRERRTQHPGGTLRDWRKRYPNECSIDPIVPKTLIDGRALRLQTIIADIMDIVVINIGVEGYRRIIDCIGSG